MKVKLEDVCKNESSNLMQKDVINRSGHYPIYGAAGKIGNVDFYHQMKSYVAVVKDGAGIGRTMLLPAKSSVIGTMQYLVPCEVVIPQYLYYVVKHMHLEKYYTGATIPHIYFKDYKKEVFNLSPLDKQEEIVGILNKIEKLIDYKRQVIQRLQELIKARFVEMFGDPITNPKKWLTKPFLNMGTCKNGMNFHYDDAGVEINCLGVGDFKDHAILTDTSSLPKISLNTMPSWVYLLQDGDIVFVRSNGNKRMVGRSIVVYPGKIPTTFSGFCIRYRLNDRAVAIPYLLRVLKTDSMRQKMYGRGANIQNLNQQTLSSLVIPVPPLELQIKFAAFVTQIDKSKVAVQQSLDKTQMLFDSLMQQYFG